jgi:hypothetical protein
VNFSIKLLIFLVFYFLCSEHRKNGKERLVPGLKKKQLSLLHNLEQARQDSRRCVKQYIYIFIFKLKIKNMITVIPEVNYEASSNSNGDGSSSYVFVIQEVMHSPSISFFFS